MPSIPAIKPIESVPVESQTQGQMAAMTVLAPIAASLSFLMRCTGAAQDSGARVDTQRRHGKWRHANRERKSRPNTSFPGAGPSP